MRSGVWVCGCVCVCRGLVADSCKSTFALPSCTDVTKQLLLHPALEPQNP